MSVNATSGSSSAWELWAAQRAAQQNASQTSDSDAQAAASGQTDGASATPDSMAATGGGPGRSSFLSALNGFLAQLQPIFKAGGSGDAPVAATNGTAGVAPPPQDFGSTTSTTDATSSASSLSADASSLMNDLQSFVSALQSGPSATDATTATSSQSKAATDATATVASSTASTGTAPTDLAAKLAQDLETFMSSLMSGVGATATTNASLSDSGAANAGSADPSTATNSSQAASSQPHHHHHHHLAQAIESYLSQSTTQAAGSASTSQTSITA